MKRYTSWEIAEIRARRCANAARQEAEAAKDRERATTVALIVGVVLGLIAWVGLMVWAGRHLLDVWHAAGR